MSDKPLGQIKRLRLELAEAETQRDLAIGAMREARRLLRKAEGGCVAKALVELERHLPPWEGPERKPCV